jgi:DNA-binding GntR family transcriptional regulator
LNGNADETSVGGPPGGGAWTEVPTLSQAVADWIATGIVNARWREGERLREIDIAKELGISRAPVREALRILHERQLVTHTARSGAVVNSFSIGTIREVYGLRAVIESWVTRCSVPNLTPDDHSALRQLLQTMDQVQDTDRPTFFKAGWDFRQRLYSGHPNATAMSMVSLLRARLHSLPQYLRTEQGHVQLTLKAYRALAKAAQSGDADACARLVNDFLTRVGEDMCRMFTARTLPTLDDVLPTSTSTVLKG